MAKMAAELFSISKPTPPNDRLAPRRLKWRIGASQPTNDQNKFYKELGMFALRKKIEDLVLRAEMLAPTALGLEEERCIEQEEVLRQYNLWDDLAKSNDILTKLADSVKAVDDLKDLKYKAEEAKLITELAEMDAINYGFLKQAYSSSVNVNKYLDKYEMAKLLKEPYDSEGACLVIDTRPEGTHSEGWAEQLTHMYMKWAEKHGHAGRIVEKRPSKNGGIMSAVVEFEFKFAYGYLSGERGVHRMIKNFTNEPFYETTGLAAVDVIPLFLESPPELLIDENDLAVSTPLSSEEGLGRMSPICIEHIPTGLAVHSTGERSSFANKIKALNRLKARLLIILRDQGISSLTSIRKDAIINIWNQETRRYVYQPKKLVQDVKSGIQLPDLSAVLNGNIEPLVSANVHMRQPYDVN